MQTAILHAIALGRFVTAYTRSWAINCSVQRIRFTAELDHAAQEIALLTEENRLLRARILAMPSCRRPHFSHADRFAILELKAARGWNASCAGRRLVLSPATIAAWLKRVDADGQNALLALPAPVNKFPDALAHLVKRLKLTLPFAGRRRIADLLARAGLHLSASTVKRLLERDPPDPERPAEGRPSSSPAPAPVLPNTDVAAKPCTVVARYPGHAWGIDLTPCPIAGGFWTTWCPCALPQGWPFAWWLAIVVDYYSRKVICAQAFPTQPSAHQVTELLDLAVAMNGSAPKYIVSDKGAHFQDDYRAWCLARSVEPRYGALHRYGSIALVERLTLALKAEAFRRILLPLSYDAMRDLLASVVLWYNQHRPHQSLRGARPEEVFLASSLARDGPRFEPRPRYPATGKVAARAPVETRGEPDASLRLVIDYVDGNTHLPIVSLRAA